MKRGQPDPSRLQTTHLGEVVWSGHCGSTQESPALLQLWHLTGGVTSLLLLQLWHLILGNNCPSAPALAPDSGGVTSFLQLQLWYLTGGVTSSLLLHLCFPAHLSALKDCGLCVGDMWRVAWKLLLILRIQRQIKTQAHSKVIAYQILDRNNVVLLWILLNYSPNPSVMQKFSKLWENLID